MTKQDKATILGLWEERWRHGVAFRGEIRLTPKDDADSRRFTYTATRNPEGNRITVHCQGLKVDEFEVP